MSTELETLQENTQRLTNVMDNYLDVVRDSLSGMADKVSRLAGSIHGSGESTIPTSQCMFSEESQELLQEIKTNQTENFGLILSKLDEIYQILNNSSDNGISSITDYLTSDDEKDYLIQSTINQMLADESLSSFTNDISSLIETSINDRNNLINRTPTEYDFSNDFEKIDSIDEVINLLDSIDQSNNTFSLKRDNSSPVDNGFTFGSYLRTQLESALKDINNAKNNPPSGVYIEYEEAFQHNYCKNARAIINKQRQISEIIDIVVQKLKDQSNPFYLAGFILGFTKNKSKCNKYKRIYNHVQKGNASIITDPEKQEEFELKYFSTDFILSILNSNISIPFSKSLIDYSRVKNTVNIVPILESALETIDDTEITDAIRKMTMNASDGLVMSKDNFDKIVLAEVLANAISNTSSSRSLTTNKRDFMGLDSREWKWVFTIGLICAGIMAFGIMTGTPEIALFFCLIVIGFGFVAILFDSATRSRDSKRKAFDITSNLFDDIKELIILIEDLTKDSRQKLISVLYEDINAHHAISLDQKELIWRWKDDIVWGANFWFDKTHNIPYSDPDRIKIQDRGVGYWYYYGDNGEEVTVKWCETTGQYEEDITGTAFSITDLNIGKITLPMVSPGTIQTSTITITLHDPKWKDLKTGKVYQPGETVDVGFFYKGEITISQSDPDYGICTNFELIDSEF